MAFSEIRRGSTTRTDDQGEYIAYHRTCTYQGCRVELTSRNRYDGNLLCIDCGRAKGRERFGGRPRRQSAIASAVATAKRDDPTRQKAHHLLESFLNHPTNEDIKKGLYSYLMTLEIKALMRNL